ncbi:MAG: sugar ABC transporter ATP-binding protein [Actinobacteria bacterium]|nr:sugar ABC transporter ATP-binding protein [Actinomycetota bacterium]
MPAEPSSVPALRVREVRKDFPGTRALDGVSLDVLPGEVHALVGGNGCGKSTLMKILAGVQPADAGSAEIGGAVHDLRHFSAALARRCGLHFVHQQSSVFPDMTVAENLAIGRGYETGPLGAIRWARLRRRVAAVLERFEIAARPDDRVDRLRPATQTMVAIARALQDQEVAHEGVLALDEPTASLPPDEVATVLDALRRCAARGQAIVFISHRLDEVLGVADRITVLRDGRVVATVARDGLDHDGLVELIVGRRVEPLAAAAPAAVREAADAAPALEVAGLAGGAVRGADLTLHAGEVVGVAGLNGSGRSTLLRLLFGEQQAREGSVRAGGRALALARPRDAIDAGFAYVPEDRAVAGLFPELSVAENLSGGFAGDYARHGRLVHRLERADARAAMERFLIRAASPEVAISTLSGGNQQKVVLARWLRRRPHVLLLDEPSHGVDVGARAEIAGLIRAAAEEGTAVLAVSSDFEELVALCDRVLLMREGRIAGEVAGAQLTVERIDHLLHSEAALS